MNRVTGIAGKPAPTPKTACPTPACTCRSELARDGGDAVYMKNRVIRIAGKPAPTTKAACSTRACRSELARDGGDAVYMMNRVTRIAGKPAPTTKKSMRISYLKSAYGINGCTGIGKLPCQVSNVYRR